MKKELLSPAGSMDCAYAAINNGADAIYLSGIKYGARAFASNFSNDEIIEIVNHAHLLNVKVYITVNTLITDDEFVDAIDYIEFLHHINVDAVILQDIGFAKLIHKKFPNLEMHASTQMHNLDNFSSLFLKNLGFKRIVVARELSLGEINKIDDNLEIEAFIHGSLCVAYSGQCLLSSLAMNRSGNRGACSQLCRMPYSLKVCDKNLNTKKYLLSPKDLSSFDNFDLIMKSNIKSLKIEGRMKSVAYVGLITKIYRTLIDDFENSTKTDISTEIRQLNYLFNRGYTKGFLQNETNIINNKRPNHAGVLIGEVIKCTPEKITVKLNENLNIKDGIKFEESDKGFTVYNMKKNNTEIKSAFKNDIVEFPNKIELENLDSVLKTYDDQLNEILSKSLPKKVLISVRVEALIGQKLSVSFNDGINEVTLEKDIVTKAINKATTIDDITEKICKLGASVYQINDLNINVDDNAFIRLSDINSLRQELINLLNDKRTQRKYQFKKCDYQSEFKKEDINTSLAVYVRNKRQLGIVKNYNVDVLYTDDLDIVLNNPDLNIYYDLGINESIDKKINKLLVNSTSDIEKYKKLDKVLNYNLNIYNSETLNYLSDFGKCVYSAELNLNNISKINKNVVDKGELLIYGKPKVMTIKTCVVNNDKKCASCNLNCKDKTLIDDFNRDYVLSCKDGINYLYNHKPILKIRDLAIYKSIGIKRFRIDFCDESDYEIRKILNEYFDL